MGLGIIVIALVVSLITYWRTELRGPRTACLAVPGTTVVAIGKVDYPSPRLLVNVWRDLIFTNDGHRPASISLVTCNMTPAPNGLTVERADVPKATEYPRALQIFAFAHLTLAYAAVH